MYLDGEGLVTVDPVDQCYRCEHLQDCPLVHAVSEGMVSLAFEDITVKNCGLYQGPQPLKVVK
jgi:hypothetical protein